MAGTQPTDEAIRSAGCGAPNLCSLPRQRIASEAIVQKLHEAQGGAVIKETANNLDARRKAANQASRRGNRRRYRRLHILLKRKGVEINWKKLYRLYREERLTVRKRGGRKRPWEHERR